MTTNKFILVQHQETKSFTRKTNLIILIIEIVLDKMVYQKFTKF